MSDRKNLKANDPRILLKDNKVTSNKKVTERASVQVQNEIEACAHEGFKERQQIKRKYRLLKENKELTRAEKKLLSKKCKKELKKSAFENARAQALIYANSQNQPLPTNLTTREYSHISDRAFLPQYSRGEDIFSAVAHFAGGGFSIAMLIIGIVLASVEPGITNRPIAITGAFVFGLCAIILYTISSIYHFLWINKAKKVFRIFDHSSIYVLIAGSYTPFCLYGVLNYAYGASGNLYGWILLSIEWGLGILLIVCNCLWLKSNFILVMSVIGYVILGWGIIAFVPQLVINVGTPGLICLVLGGVSYTIGAVMFSVGPKIKYMHGVSHIMYDIGTILHFLTLCFLLTGVGNPQNLLIR